jgi:hypothetical protein
MRANYRGDKRRKEEARKKKQEDKRNKRLQRKLEALQPDTSSAVPPAEDPVSHVPEDDTAAGTTQ